MTKRGKEQLVEQLAAISDGKWVESGPEMKKRICHLSFYIQTVVESFSGVQDEMYEVKKEIKEIKKVTAEVTQIKDKITQVSEQMMNLESKIDEKHNNIQGLVNTTMGALQNIETKLENDEEESTTRRFRVPCLTCKSYMDSTLIRHFHFFIQPTLINFC